MAYKIRPRAGSAAEWTAANPVLAEREIAYEYHSNGLGAGYVKMKMGDGVTHWNDLPYAVEVNGGSSGSGLTEAMKTALLQLASKVAYIDANGQDYYNDLYDALYAVTAITLSSNSLTINTIGGTSQLTATTTPAGANVTWSSSNTSVATVSSTGLVTSVAYGSCTITATAGGLTASCSILVAQVSLTSISATYTQSGTVYDTDDLDDLKSDLVVTATWSDSTTSTVSSNDYMLSGTLTSGTSTITVSYGGCTDTFNVTVVGLSSITATYTQSGTVYDTDSLDDLKSDLVVTAHYDDSSSAVVTTYTLSGTLSAGTSTITVSYGGKTATFTVTVSHQTQTIKTYFSDTSYTSNYLKKTNGTDQSIGGGAYTELDYVDGMYIHARMNSSWSAYLYYVLFDGTNYSSVAMTKTGSEVYPTYEDTLSGYTATKVYVNFRLSNIDDCYYEVEV